MKTAVRSANEGLDWVFDLEFESALESETPVFNYTSVPASVMRPLIEHRFVDAVKAAISLGDKNENSLSDLVFFTCHPERCGAFIQAGEPDSIKTEWVGIRDKLVRPLLTNKPAQWSGACTIKTAGTFAEYVCLVRTAEARSGLSPRMMLSFLRQMYYGDQTWSRDRNAIWNDVIRCRQTIQNAESLVGNALVSAFHNSVLVQNTDMGHMFTGLEAMACPTPDVTVNVWGDNAWGLPNPWVAMPNEEFASWGGDIGSAAAQRAWDHYQSGTAPQWAGYFGGTNTLASDTDLNGDIDCYVIRQALLRRPCQATVQVPLPALTIPISQILDEYYSGGSTALGTAWLNRFDCFARTLGANIVARRITNMAALGPPISGRVYNFARAFLAGVIGARPRNPIRMNTLLTQACNEVTQLFLNWIQARL